MIGPELFVSAAEERGLSIYAGVPCSYLKPLIDYTSEREGLQYVRAANEGEAVSIAAGASLAGRYGIAMFQNSGLGNAVNPLVSICATFRAPVLLICTWRGEPQGEPDEPQHDLMGEITPDLLEVMRIPWELFPSEEREVGPALNRALQTMRNGSCFAFVMQKGSVRGQSKKRTARVSYSPKASLPPRTGWRLSRREVLTAIRRRCADAALVASTGHIARSLYAIGDTERQLYVVGGMGCASSIGMGLAIADCSRRVVVLDGDGAALMRLGAMSTIGHHRPRNLVHVVLDNQVYESTGGQESMSGSTDLAAVAAACAYPVVTRAKSADDAAEIAADAEELTFIHVNVETEPDVSLPRPIITPVQVASRFRKWFSDLGVATENQLFSRLALWPY